MAISQKTISNKAYYTDGVNYYTFHVIESKSDPFWKFAAQDLGINKATGFTPDEEKKDQRPGRNRHAPENKVPALEKWTGCNNAIQNQRPGRQAGGYHLATDVASVNRADQMSALRFQCVARTHLLGVWQTAQALI
ncbi:MAG: hypothetical protein L0287_14580 [Anaerolineae bacterium]|nr:hypothetical protein [Anaerolineae bacterium]